MPSKRVRQRVKRATSRSMTRSAVSGVALPRDHTGSSWLHDLLLRAVVRYPHAFGKAPFPKDPRRFKDGFDEALVRFEAARVASPDRAEIARFICLEAERGVRFVRDGVELPLDEALASGDPLPVARAELPPAEGLIPEVPWEGRGRTGVDLHALLEHWRARRYLTDAAAAAVAGLLRRSGDRVSLRGERFVLLGAAAELAPTDLLLAAGAEVLWVDIREPDAARLRDLRGALSYVRGGADLLTAPGAIAATIRQFAGDRPVHLGLYAYAGGESQEWRLTMAMNAIVRRLPRALVGSISMLVSPTTPGVVSAEDAAMGAQRRREAPGWKRALERLGRLKPGHLPTRLASGREACMARAIVPVQGASYQAAQYIGKILSAEACAVWGNDLDGAPVTVSANVAPITRTRSLSHPVFEAGFLAAPRFDLLISDPGTTRNLNGLLAIADVTDPEAPAAAGRAWPTSAERAEAVHARQMHGGVFTFPWRVYSGIQVAAVMGFVEKPGLLVRLVRGR